MHTLKDIARRMDCHERTAKRWTRKLRVPADIIGHGPNRWHDENADKLIKLWATYYARKGTTPEIIRAKYAGQPTDSNQLDLLSWKQNLNQCPPAVSLPKSGKKPAPNKKPTGPKPVKPKANAN